IDHPRLGFHAQILDRELPERPLTLAIGTRADLEDKGLAAFAWEGAEVIVHVMDELEVDEGLGRRRHPPPLLIRADVIGTQHLAVVSIHRDDRIERESVLAVEAEDRRRGPRVVPARDADSVPSAAKLEIHPRKDRELAKLRCDLGLRAMPGEVAARFHVRPELGDRRDREAPPLGALGSQSPDPGDRAPDDRSEVFVLRADERLARHASELLPAPITAPRALAPRAAGDVCRGRGEALAPPGRL